MKISQNDTHKITDKNKILPKNSKLKNDENLEKENDDLDYLEYFVYNPDWTLRKCSSKLIDKISCIYSMQTLNYLKPFLENDLQCNDWIKK